MTIIRNSVPYDNPVNYIATLALLCGISCTILMLRFRGFKASFNLSSGKRITSSQYHEDIPILSTTNGAYRTNREEFFGNGSLSEVPKKNINPSMVKLPQNSKQNSNVKPSKSTSDLTQAINTQPNLPSSLHPNVSKSTPDVSLSPPRETTNVQQPPTVKKLNTKDAKNQDKDQKKLEKERLTEEKQRLAEEKKRLAEDKKRQNLAAKEQAKQEKERKAKEKKEAQLQAKQAQQAQLQAKKAKQVKAKGKDTGKTATAQPRANPLAQGPPPGPSQAQVQYSTNTLESSISRTSGPPAYAEATKPDVVQNENDNTGNTSFGKPVDNSSSWDMITQHRQQISRPPVAGGSAPIKQTVLDLEYTRQTGRKSVYL